MTRQNPYIGNIAELTDNLQGDSQMLLKRRRSCLVGLLRNNQSEAWSTGVVIRCKAGDTAIILFDEPECLGNVGRLVKVHPTLQINHRLELECWLIEPLDGLPWFIAENDGTISHEVVSLSSNIEHPDAWMLPIQEDFYTDEESAAYARIQERIDQNLVEIGAIRPASNAINAFT